MHRPRPHQHLDDTGPHFTSWGVATRNIYLRRKPSHVERLCPSFTQLCRYPHANMPKILCPACSKPCSDKRALQDHFLAQAVDGFRVGSEGEWGNPRLCVRAPPYPLSKTVVAVEVGHPYRTCCNNKRFKTPATRTEHMLQVHKVCDGCLTSGPA